MTATTMAPSTARPPITPPTMGPMGVDLEDEVVPGPAPAAGDGVETDEGVEVEDAGLVAAGVVDVVLTTGVVSETVVDAAPGTREELVCCQCAGVGCV